jgi:DNA-binding NarL/FixJ family response regulator
MKKPKHIFIVEDNEIYSMMLDYILSKESIYEFVSFNSGEECLKNLYLNPDVIILDYGLPGKNGFETLLEIKKYNRNIHVIFLTNNQDKKLKADLLKAGADDYILKQGHGEKQIIEKIEQILSRDEYEKTIRQKTKIRSVVRKVSYLALFALVVVAGILLSRKEKDNLSTDIPITVTGK